MRFFRLSLSCIFAAYLSTLMVYGQASNQQTDTDKAKKFLIDVINRAQTVAKTNDHSLDQRRKFSEILTNAFAMDTISKFVLANHFNDFNKDQLKAFTELLREYLLTVYSSKERVNQFANANINFKEMKSPACDHMCIFEINITIGSRTTLNVQFSLRKIDNNYKITDISFEGISTSMNLRDQIRSMISSHHTTDKFLDAFRVDVNRRMAVQ